QAERGGKSAEQDGLFHVGFPLGDADGAAPPLLFVFFGHALRLVVRDTLVAVDAGHVVLEGHFMLLARALLLGLALHAFEAVAIAAFARIGGFHALPFATR